MRAAVRFRSSSFGGVMVVARRLGLLCHAAPRRARSRARRVPLSLPAQAPRNKIMADKQWSTPPEMQIDATKDYTVSIETNRGTIELTLHPQHAPKTVNNFVFLAKQGYYDGVKFHRVIADFKIQTGDPTATGRGGPVYTFG